MINSLNFFNVKQNIPIKRENISFKAQISALKTDTIEFTNKKLEVIKNNLNKLYDIYSSFLPESVIEEGTGLIEELLKNSDIEKISDKFIEWKKYNSPKQINFHFALTMMYGFNQAEDTNDEIRKKYFKQMPLNLFKTELLSIANNIIQDKENPKNIKILKQIRHLGLSPEEKKWTQKIESDFNLTLTPFNDVGLLKRTYEELAIHKEYFKNMPNHIDMVDLFPFYTNYKDAIGLYENISKKISINPMYIFREKFEGNNNNNIMNALKHELGHHITEQATRPTKIDFNRLLNQQEMDLLNRLTPEHIDTSKITDKKVKKHLDTTLSQKIQDSPDSFNTNVYRKVYDIHNYMVELSITWKDRNLLEQMKEKIFDTKAILALYFTEDQLAKLKQMILNNYGKESLENSLELIANFFENSTQKHPSPEMQEVLDIFGMPELTDRCILPENHPVIQPSLI